jgi:hypothetical protein
MDLQQLQTLKEKLGSAKDFGDVQNYFLDHFGEDPQFMALGEPALEPLVEATLATAVAQLCGRPEPVTQLRLLRLAEQQFLHGGFFVKGLPGSVFYFEDVQLGLATVVWSLEPPETKFVRFSARPAPPGHRPSRN